MVELCLSIRFQFSQIKIEMSSQPVYHVRMQGTSIDVRFPVERGSDWSPQTDQVNSPQSTGRFIILLYQEHL